MWIVIIGGIIIIGIVMVSIVLFPPRMNGKFSELRIRTGTDEHDFGNRHKTLIDQ